MRGLTLLVLIGGSVLCCTWSAVRIVSAIQYDQNCGGYLKRAADANTVELAKKELATALDWLNANDLKNGYTSVAWRTPNEDVGFWYTNLTVSLQELESVNMEASQLEKSNVLMKLRETLLDQGKRTTVTDPDGISVYPNNVALAWFGWISLLILFAGCILGIRVIHEYFHEYY